MGNGSYQTSSTSRTPTGYTPVFYDANSGQLMMLNPKATKAGGGKLRNEPRYIPVGGNYGQTAYTPPAVDFNKLPNQVPAGVQIYGGGVSATPYQRPTQPTAPTNTGYRPQFDTSFIQQMLAQRFGENQNAGIPTVTQMNPPAGGAGGAGGIQSLMPTNAAQNIGGTYLIGTE